MLSGKAIEFALFTIELPKLTLIHIPYLGELSFQNIVVVISGEQFRRW
jgi:hypothetical protein